MLVVQLHRRAQTRELQTHTYNRMNEGLIKLRAVNGLQQGKLTLTPARHKITGKLLGVAEGASKHPDRPVDANTTRDISEGLVLDIKNSIVDKIDWEWIRQTKEVVGSLEEALANPQALYYVDQPDREVEKRISREKKSFQAQMIIHESSEARKQELSRLLGQDPKFFRPIDLEDFLLTQAKNTPDRILEAANDPDAKEKLFIFKCMDAGKIRKDVHGVYRFGDMALGTSIRLVIDFMTNEKNKDIIAQLYSSIYGAPTPARSILSQFESDLVAAKSGEEETGTGSDGESAGDVE